MNRRTSNLVYVLTHSTTVGIIAGLALLFVLSLGGCNTVKGIAKDVYSITEGVQNEMAEDSSRDGVRPNDWD
jgi:predicted small secreted protein